jgi:hypothetical protein
LVAAGTGGGAQAGMPGVSIIAVNRASALPLSRTSSASTAASRVGPRERTDECADPAPSRAPPAPVGFPGDDAVRATNGTATTATQRANTATHRRRGRVTVAILSGLRHAAWVDDALGTVHPPLSTCHERIGPTRWTLLAARRIVDRPRTEVRREPASRRSLRSWWPLCWCTPNHSSGSRRSSPCRCSCRCRRPSRWPVRSGRP